MTFGKPGRPAEDRLARQREIYEAVAPLILRHGARNLSMRAAAQAASMSIGGLYHYFPGKRDLVLHGLQHEAVSRNCERFHERFGALAEADPVAFWNAYVGFVMESIRFIRPAFNAALELRFQALESTLEPTLTAAADEFTSRARTLFPCASEDDLRQFGRAIPRALLGALLDRNLEEAEFRREIAVLIDGYLRATQAVSLAVGGSLGRHELGDDVDVSLGGYGFPNGRS